MVVVFRVVHHDYRKVRAETFPLAQAEELGAAVVAGLPDGLQVVSGLVYQGQAVPGSLGQGGFRRGWLDVDDFGGDDVVLIHGLRGQRG